MGDAVTIPEEMEALRDRVASLARDNAHLKLINGMLTRLSSASGLSNVVNHILTILMETIGGTNLVIYYTMEGKWHSRDVFGVVREMASPDDPLVASALRDGVFIRSAPSLSGDIRQETWVFPMHMQQRIIGAVAMEGMQLTDSAIQSELQPFFVYAALMLGNELSNYSALEIAHKELLATHRELELQIAARQEAEEHYRILFEQSPDGVLLVDPQSRMPIRFNTAAHQHLGYSREEFAALTMADIAVVDSEEDLDQCAQVLMKQGFSTFEALHRAKDGQIRNVLVTGKVLPLESNKLILTIFRDITDIKKMEEELLRAQKLESVGLLAGGIAHDFNNLLMAILGNTSLARMSVPPDSRAFDLLGESEKACQRARDLTQQLLTFAKGGAPLKKLTNLGKLIQESATFAVRGSNSRCDFRIPADLWNAEIDGGQISQVIHNLVINADQAMPGGGTILVSCGNIPAPAGSVAAVNYVRIDIQDHGIGIQLDLLPKIFDPYFTTKQKGSGLGLASSYSIIRKHNGRIEVESTPGAGTTFHIYLPAATETAVQDAPAEETAHSRQCRILVMDDDNMVLEVVAMMLTDLGHEVETAQDGAEAVVAYKKAMAEGRKFDLTILDLTVPGAMGGKEALHCLRELDPGVKAVVSSGYSDDTTVTDFRSFGFSGVLSKPYNVHDMEKTVAELSSWDRI